MCGRYDLTATAQELVERFGVPVVPLGDDSVGVTANGNAEWRPRYNIAPSQRNPVVVRDASGHNNIELMGWGLVPAWSKQSKVPYSTINARAETLTSKPTFRKPLSTQRCLVPATAYFEWTQGGKAAGMNQSSQGKQPYRIGLRGQGEHREHGEGGLGGIFAMAGLYDIWQGPDGEALHTYTIVTTEANDALHAIHSRMPVILPRDIEGVWLDRDNKDIETLISLLQPYPAEEMRAYPVSRLVNSPSNEGRELIAALRN
jgi:putative SOS response-associated peptidase YedK